MTPYFNVPASNLELHIGALYATGLLTLQDAYKHLDQARQYCDLSTIAILERRIIKG